VYSYSVIPAYPRVYNGIIRSSLTISTNDLSYLQDTFYLLRVKIYNYRYENINCVEPSGFNDQIIPRGLKGNSLTVDVVVVFSVVYSVFCLVLWHCTTLCYCFSSVYFTFHCSCIVLCLLVMYVLLP
jgi:hypothetical protein